MSATIYVGYVELHKCRRMVDKTVLPTVSAASYELQFTCRAAADETFRTEYISRPAKKALSISRLGYAIAKTHLRYYWQRAYEPKIFNS
jgi:hypothetical protein